jgi:hypothetical protein
MAPNAHPGKPLLDGSPGPSLYCAVIVKTVDAQTAPRGGFTTCRGTGKLPSVDKPGDDAFLCRRRSFPNSAFAVPSP